MQSNVICEDEALDYTEILFPSDLLASRLADLRLRLAEPELAPAERDEMETLFEDLLLQATVRGLSTYRGMR